MLTSSSAGSWQLRWIIVGAVAGAVVRHLITEIWDRPAQLLLSIVITMTIAGSAIGAVLTWPVRQQLRSLIWGMAGAAGSLSGYTALAIDQPALAAVVILLVIPGCALAGLYGGAVVGLRFADTRDEGTLP
ncbi:hypothetical protein VST63_08465 [Mycolicibacterium sp. 050232]|uniref:hypothetical protein n=1 Tax=Mycolicibacterium sp. 050232 TaxID=3113982 RepID=UPI002E27B9AA|nr:hypothetical protein [Mycolicibacterium sp. 050232]MED5812392.1 hypothetical protein [Mycolicibacterium sp. 050232]